MWNEIYHGMLRRVSTWWAIGSLRKITRIRVETDRVLLIQRRHSTRAWCPECAREVEMVQAEEAAALTGAAQQSVPNGAAYGKCHVSYTPGGSRLICLESLMKSL